MWVNRYEILVWSRLKHSYLKIEQKGQDYESYTDKNMVE
jgi:hypothetical protein